MLRKLSKFGAALFGVAVLLLPWLAQAQTAGGQSALDSILASGKLRFGTTSDWNPMTMRDPANNERIGFDIDVAKALAADLGVEVEFVPTTWKTIVAGVASGAYDMTGSASVTVGRAKTAGYTQPYLALATVPVTLAANADKFQSIDDINQEGVRVAVTAGTSQQFQAPNLFPKATIIKVEAPARDFGEVLAGRADVSITSNVEANTLVKRFDQLAIVPAKPAFPTLIAMLTPRDDQAWINYLNHWIAIKKELGFFDELQAKWMGGGE
jgi:cyclohexadienyl dehydratase